MPLGRRSRRTHGKRGGDIVLICGQALREHQLRRLSVRNDGETRDGAVSDGRDGLVVLPDRDARFHKLEQVKLSRGVERRVEWRGVEDVSERRDGGQLVELIVNVELDARGEGQLSGSARGGLALEEGRGADLALDAGPRKRVAVGVGGIVIIARVAARALTLEEGREGGGEGGEENEKGDG